MSAIFFFRQEQRQAHNMVGLVVKMMLSRLVSARCARSSYTLLCMHWNHFVLMWTLAIWVLNSSFRKNYITRLYWNDILAGDDLWDCLPNFSIRNRLDTNCDLTPATMPKSTRYEALQERISIALLEIAAEHSLLAEATLWPYDSKAIVVIFKTRQEIIHGVK